jgi:pyruvate dehydrogenase E1 component alpha subunit
MDLNFLTNLLRTMVRIRRFEEKIADQILANKIKTPCHLYIGQEAIATGVCATLEKEDMVWGCHRSHGHYLAKGGDARAMMAEIFGRSTGCSGGRGGSMHLVAPEVGVLGTVPIVAGTIPLAVGGGFAAKLSHSKKVSVAFFGDGAMEEGHFHESVNLAAVYRLPVIFVCENNFYSSHLPLLQRRREDNLVKAAEFHGIHGERVDGNDVIAVHQAAAEAVKKARAGEGPSFLEFRTYRWRGHVGASWDEDVGVKRKDELQEWKPKDPILRLKKQLTDMGTTLAELERIESEAMDEAEEATAYAQNAPLPGPQELLRNIFVAKTGEVS